MIHCQKMWCGHLRADENPAGWCGRIYAVRQGLPGGMRPRSVRLVKESKQTRLPDLARF
jgi:hypothetical protein